MSNCYCPDCEANRIARDCNRADFEKAVRDLIDYLENNADRSPYSWNIIEKLIKQVKKYDY